MQKKIVCNKSTCTRSGQATAEDVQGMFVCLHTEVVVKEEEEMVVAADEEMEEEEMEEEVVLEVVCERWDHTASHTCTSTRERGAEIGRYTVG